MTSKPIIEVALRLTGQGFVPEDVTKLIQLAPTKTWRLGEPVQQTQLKRKTDGWVLALPKREAYDMDVILRELLEIVEPYKDRIAKATKQFVLNKEISFAVYINGETPASWFAAETMRRVADCEVNLDIDLILLG